MNTAELTNLLIQQNHIGSVIKQTDVSEDSDEEVDEDEIFGFISLLNLTERKVSFTEWHLTPGICGQDGVFCVRL